MSADNRLRRLENYDQGGQCAVCGHIQGKRKCDTAEATALIDKELKAAFAELDDIIRKGQV